MTVFRGHVNTMTRRGRQGHLMSSSRTMAWPARPALSPACRGEMERGQSRARRLLASPPRAPPPPLAPPRKREREHCYVRRETAETIARLARKICIAFSRYPDPTLKILREPGGAPCCKLWDMPGSDRPRWTIGGNSRPDC